MRLFQTKWQETLNQSQELGVVEERVQGNHVVGWVLKTRVDLKAAKDIGTKTSQRVLLTLAWTDQS